MALAFYVDNPDALAKAFAAHDEYMAVLTYFVRGKNSKCRMLTPDGDDYYSAPFCFMPKHLPPPGGGAGVDNGNGSNGNGNGNGSNRGGGGGRGGGGTGYLVFTSQVPWLHGNPKSDRNERAHYQAEDWMRDRGGLDPPFIGTVEDFQHKMGLGEGGVHAFTSDGCYPACDEISQALEDKAVEVTCSVLGWKVPANWRSARRKMTVPHGIPILNLAEWDQHQRQRRMAREGKGGGGGGYRSDDGEDVDDDARARARARGRNDGGGGGDVRRNDATTTTTTTRNDDADVDVEGGVGPPDRGGGDGDGGDDDRQEEKKDCSTEEQRRHQC